MAINQSANIIEVPIVDGATVAVGDNVSWSGSFAGTAGGRVRQADARFGSAAPGFTGVALTGGTGNAGGTVTCVVQTDGVVDDSGASFTVGPLYLSTAAAGGRPTNTPPSLPADAGNYWIEVGIALSATSWLIQPKQRIAL